MAVLQCSGVAFAKSRTAPAGNPRTFEAAVQWIAVGPHLGVAQVSTPFAVPAGSAYASEPVHTLFHTVYASHHVLGGKPSWKGGQKQHGGHQKGGHQKGGGHNHQKGGGNRGNGNSDKDQRKKRSEERNTALLKVLTTLAHLMHRPQNSAHVPGSFLYPRLVPGDDCACAVYLAQRCLPAHSTTCSALALDGQGALGHPRPGLQARGMWGPPTSLTSAAASLHHNVLNLQILRSSFLLPRWLRRAGGGQDLHGPEGRKLQQEDGGLFDVPPSFPRSPNIELTHAT